LAATQIRADYRQVGQLHSAQNPTAPVSQWHISCGIQRRTEDMANKAMLMKLLQESRGHEQITNRRPTPRPIVLYLMQLRGRTAQANAPKQSLAITAEWQNDTETPLPIKIKHIQSDESDPPIVFG
jgi:hypothetical protein